MSQSARSTVEVHVNLEVPPAFVLSESPTRILRAGVEGTGWQLLQLIRQNKIKIDLKPGKSTAPQQWSSDQLRLRLSDLPPFKDIRVVSINPARINIILDSAYVKEVPIQLPYQINYERGYSNTAPLSIEPSKLKVSGPKSKVSDLQSWVLDSLILKNVHNSQVDSIPISESLNYQKVYSLSHSHVRYDLPVSEYTELKQLCKIEPPRDSLELFPRRAVVRIRVPTNRYNEAQKFDIQLSIPFDPNGNGSNVPIQVKNELPYWMKNVRISPPTADYLIPDSLVNQ
jgi:hypothetical protein